jgi:hypothetical protein
MISLSLCSACAERPARISRRPPEGKRNLRIPFRSLQHTTRPSQLALRLARALRGLGLGLLRRALLRRRQIHIARRDRAEQLAERVELELPCGP